MPSSALKHLRIFLIESSGHTLIVTPQSEGGNFRYADLQMEANSVRQALRKPEIQNILIDLSNMGYFGSEFIGALVQMCREVKNRGGSAALCSAQPQMLDVLKNMSLFKLWPHFDDRDGAISHLENPADVQ